MRKISLTLLFLFLSLFIAPLYSPVQAESLYVRTDKSYVRPGSFYNLSVLINSTKKPFSSNTGLLDVNVTSCYQSDCKTTSGHWGNYSVQNGSVRLNIATSYTPGRFRARFKPRDSDWDWSNEVQIDVGTTQDLENSQDYWLFPTRPTEFIGTNFADNKNFKTMIGFENPTDTGDDGKFCGETVRTMYFMKNNPSGYWGPHYPWFGSVGDNNLFWHLALWQTKQSWIDKGFDDEYLTSIGYKTYQYNPEQPFDRSANFTTGILQKRKAFPDYILSPKWVGNGWGIQVNAHSSLAITDTAKPLCNLPIVSGDPSIWVAHADIVNIKLSRYQGPALKYTYYQGDSSNCFFNSTENTLREDWYFVKNIGLVEIDQKYFGSISGIRKPCQEDKDCLVNEIMSSPHIKLVRSDMTLLPGDLNSDGKINIFDYNELVSKWNKPYTNLDYQNILTNFGK